VVEDGANGVAGGAEGVGDANGAVIAQFRSGGGRVGGAFQGVPLLLLHTTGLRSGRERINPLVFLPEGRNRVVIASAGGSPRHPAWFTNLMAAPRTTIEVAGPGGVDVVVVRARVASGAERARLWERQVRVNAAVADHQRAAGRELPFVVLEPG